MEFKTCLKGRKEKLKGKERVIRHEEWQFKASLGYVVSYTKISTTILSPHLKNKTKSIKQKESQAWWHTPITPAFRRHKQADLWELQASQGNTGLPTNILSVPSPTRKPEARTGPPHSRPPTEGALISLTCHLFPDSEWLHMLTVIMGTIYRQFLFRASNCFISSGLKVKSNT